MNYLEMLMALLAIGLFIEIARTYRAFRRALAPRPYPRPLETYPSVTVIRPIKGLDVEAEQNLRAAFETDYRGEVDTLFVFDDEDEPAVPLVRQILEERKQEGRPVHARVLFAGHPPFGRTGKLNAMIAGVREARGQLIAFADSDIRPDPRALTVLVETLLRSLQAGAAFAPVVDPSPARTIGDVGHALMINGLYGTAAAAVLHEQRGELPFIMGQFMVWRREALEAIGGLESADGQLVDDMYLGARVKAAGYRNVVSPRAVPIIQAGMPLRSFLATYRRWLTFSRSGLPGWSFKRISVMQGVVFWVGLLAACIALGLHLWLAALANALVVVMLSASLNRLHHAIGGAPLALRHAWVSAALILVAPLVALTLFTSRRVTWRGRSYELDPRAQLARPVRAGPAQARMRANPT